MAAPPRIQLSVYGKTDVGLIREHNEDCFLVADVAAAGHVLPPEGALDFRLGPKGALLLVCDGMGGAAAGEVASRMALDVISTAMSTAEPAGRDPFARRLRRAIETANDRIFLQSRDNHSERGMGTTCTAAALIDDTLVVGQIGDSRCYVLRQDKLAQVTKDQSLAWQLIEAGAMTQEEAKAFEHANIILQALGVQEKVEVAISQVSLRRGDVVLVCSDGLHGPVTDEEIAELLRKSTDAKHACQMLIARALERDGPDNVTTIVAKFDGEDLKAPTAEDVVSFVAYDPGPDTEPRGRITAQIPKAAPPAAPESGELAPSTPTPTPTVPALKLPPPASEPRSLLTFVLLTLLAATGGAMYIRYKRSEALAREAEAAAALKRADDEAARLRAEPPPAPAPIAGAAGTTTGDGGESLAANAGPRDAAPAADAAARPDRPRRVRPDAAPPQAAPPSAPSSGSLSPDPSTTPPVPPRAPDPTASAP